MTDGQAPHPPQPRRGEMDDDDRVEVWHDGQPFWVTWAVPEIVRVADVQNAIVQGFLGLGYRARVSELRTERTVGDQLSGRAKVFVETRDDDVAKSLATLAARAQHEVRQTLLHLGARRGVGDHEVDVRIVWGERSLGSPP